METSKCPLTKAATVQHSNAARSNQIPDLLSFESWEYSAATSYNTTFSSDLGDLGEDSSILTTPSLETLKHVCSNGQQAPTLYRASRNDKMRVSVSGAMYNLDLSTFRRLERLPWQWSGDMDVVKINGGTNDIEVECSHHLHASPELFEVLLSHLTRGILPDLDYLSIADIEELEPMAMVLELNPLLKHLEENKKKNRFGMRRQSSATVRNHRKDRQRQKKEQKERQKREDILTTLNDLTSPRGEPDQKDSSSGPANKKSVFGFVQAIKNRTRRKPTHAELCASSELVQ